MGEEGSARGVVDFLSSFSIENRMGLKILIDKWLLQQSLFRGKHTKTATYLHSHSDSWRCPNCSCCRTSGWTTSW